MRSHPVRRHRRGFSSCDRARVRAAAARSAAGFPSAAAGRRRRVSACVRVVSRQSCRGLESAEPRGARAVRTRRHRERADQRQHAPPGREADARPNVVTWRSSSPAAPWAPRPRRRPACARPTRRCPIPPPVVRGTAGAPASANARFQPAKQGGLTAADVPKLTLKWAFGFPGVLAARAQPAVTGGRLFAASETGTVYALDAKTGCTYWTFRAQAGVRSAPNVGPYKSASGATRYAVYFGDSRANAYAVDAETGQQIWMRKTDDHPGRGRHRRADVVRRPSVRAGRRHRRRRARADSRATSAARSAAVSSALDATTGAVVWKTYSIAEEPKPRGKTKEGVQTWGPAGGGIWAAPTIDPRRNAIYIATGNGYSDPPQRTTDAVIALDLKTGKTKWVNQVLPGDVWMMGCQPENPDNPKCPAKQGPGLRLLRLAAPDQEREGSRPARAAAEVGHGLRARSRQGRRARLAVSDRPGQRARRPMGRRRPTDSRRTSACRTSSPRRPAACTP